MTTRIENGSAPRRKSRRVALDTEVTIRRAGFPNYRVRIRDLSPEGCKFEFVDRPSVHEHVWVKVEGLEAIEATVCWTDANLAGVKFDRPLHRAVFDSVVQKLR